MKFITSVAIAATAVAAVSAQTIAIKYVHWPISFSVLQLKRLFIHTLLHSHLALTL